MRRNTKILAVAAATVAIVFAARAGSAGVFNLPFEDRLAPQVVEFEAGSTIVEVSVSTGSDDAEESAAGVVNLASTDLELVYDSGSNQTVGVRFAAVPVPTGARIVAAWVQFRTDEIGSGAVSLTIRGEAGDDAASFDTPAFNISSRPRTAAAVAWAPAPWTVLNQIGPDQRTPDLAALIQEIVDRPGWGPGQALALIVTGTGKRTTDSFDGGLGPILHIEYRDAAPVNNPPWVDAGSDQVVPFPDAVALTGVAGDDGYPNPPGGLTTRWTLQEGPGTATFSDPTALVTAVTFSTTGVYVLRLTADDSMAQSYDEVVVTVTAPVPLTLETPVSTGADDAEESASGVVNLASTDLELVYDSGSNQTVGLRFARVAVPAGATIDAAWIQFRTDEVWSGTTQVVIRGEAGDNPASFTTSAFNISSRPRTTAAISWSPVPWTVINEAGPNQRTPGLAAVIREIVARPGWRSGQAMAFLITGTGRRTADAYEGGFATILHVEYRHAAPANEPPQVDAGADQSVPFPGPALLTGSVDDDGLPGPPGSIATRWTLQDGPGGVTFGDPAALSTTVTFSAAGIHVLRLTADDSIAQGFDDVTVTVTDTTTLRFETAVTAGSDDAEESAAGAVNLASTDLELVYDSGSNQTVGIRFAGVTVPNQALIDAAHVQFRTDEIWSDAVALQIRGEAGDDAAPFDTSARNISSRPRTTAAVAWAPGPWTVMNETGPGQRTPDLAAVIQEIVDRPGWSPGNALVLIATGTGRRTADSFDGGFGPILRLEYRAPVNDPPYADAGPDQVVQFPEPAALSGAASDDGLPRIPGTVTTRWTLVDGPGVASFSDPTALATTVTFSAAGPYVLRLTVDDGWVRSYDDVNVTAFARPLPGLVRDEDAGVSPETQGFLGPFMDGRGSLYTVVESDLDSANQPAMFKSTDGGSTWAEVDAAGRPAGVGDLEGAWMAQEGTTLHLVYQDSAGDLKYATFATSDAVLDPDRWAIRETDIVRASVTVQGCVIVPLAGGNEVWAFWHDTNGAGYAKRAGGQWGRVSRISDAKAGLTAVRGAGDRVHIFYKDPDGRIQYRTLAADGSLSAPARVDDQGSHAVFKNLTNPVVYEEGGVEAVAIAWADLAGNLRAARIVGDGGPGAEEMIPSGVALTNPGFGNAALIAALAVDPPTRTLHVLWADSPARNLFLSHSAGGGPWSAPLLIDGAARADWIHGASVYRHTPEHAGHRVIGYLIDNNVDGDELTFDIEYREIDPLPAGPGNAAP